ncbi:MAG: hypothetical protein R2710_28865 [Acidimicrobiales bacterium]
MIEVPDRKAALADGNPPIDADPPLHGWTRRLLLGPMSPKAVESYEAGTRAAVSPPDRRIRRHGSG